ncbi:DUF5462 family protein [Rahnella variigena]|jgi:hypothetical protein|uniref:DUF5462 family protein n=1 Tax=Rahnella variigena TaxID=574964 RepID=UPI000DEB28A2|nr:MULTISPECIES: DUF5462 family protein [Rahnella]RBQ33684.1 hypothetical protein C2125_13550 [Rahnella aquatilis]
MKQSVKEHRAESRILARRTWGTLGILGLLTLAAPVQSDTLNTEALGIVNGSVVTRSQIIEIKPFLSGRPLYQYSVQENEPPLTSILIEHAQGVSGTSRHDGLAWIQQSLALTGPAAAGERGIFQLPLQVEVAGRPVEVAVSENSLGLILTLPQLSRQVRVRPAGAINFILPVSYRGDVRTDIRIIGNTSTSDTTQK